MKNGFKIIDSDMHIMEPLDLWEKYIDPRFKERAPRPVRPGRATDRAGAGRVRSLIQAVTPANR